MGNRISASISETDKTTVLDAFEKIKNSLPFLQDLTKKERMGMMKIGNRLKFCNQCYELAKQNPALFPAGFDINEFEQDLKLYKELQIIRQSSMQIAELIDDTTILVGNEVFTSARLVYHYAKNARVPVEGLDNLIKELGQIFARRAE